MCGDTCRARSAPQEEQQPFAANLPQTPNLSTFFLCYPKIHSSFFSLGFTRGPLFVSPLLILLSLHWFFLNLKSYDQVSFYHTLLK